MIRYRGGDYHAHVERLTETNPVEATVPLHVRYALSAFAFFAVVRHGGHGSPASFLDVGCRLAWLADFFRDTQYIYEGIDANPHASVQAQGLGRPVSRSPERPAYDIVFCRQVLQYLDDLPGFIRYLEGLVAPGGVLVIVQSIPWSLEAPHHFSAVDHLDDIIACISLSIEHGQPLTLASEREIVILARRPA